MSASSSNDSAGPVTFDAILAARQRVMGQLRETPVLASAALTRRHGAPVLLKCENLQRTGSFKPRGAMNMLAGLEGQVAGVVAASAGNHSQGVALAATERGLAATVLMPREAPLAKRHATSDYGADVVLVDGGLADAIDQAKEMAATRGLVFVPPYDHPAVVAGQGTVGLEILDQAPDVETIVVPAGGGGLLAGVAVAVKERRPGVRVIGVQTEAMPGIVESLTNGRPEEVEVARTIADGAAVIGPSALTLDLIQRYVDDVVTVSEESIARAILFLLERARLMVEGAGALGVAALLSAGASNGGQTVAVLSGGNIDVNVVGRLVERGLLLDGRQRRLTVAASNVPGELAEITNALAAAGVNILEVTHELAPSTLPVGVTRVTFRLEMTGSGGFEELVEALLARGLHRGTVTDLVTSAAAARRW